MSRRLLVMVGLAMLAVVLFHAAGWGFTAMFAWGERYLPESVLAIEQVGSPGYYLLRFFEQFAVFCIPAFLTVSGMFAAISIGDSKLQAGWKRLAGRLRWLIVPYLIWSTIVLVGLVLRGRNLSVGFLASGYLTGSFNPAFYYIPLLVQLYLLAPILARVARSRPWTLILIVGLLQLAQYGHNYWIALDPSSQLAVQAAELLPKWFFLGRMSWFTLGLVVGYQGSRVTRGLVRRYRLFAAAAPVLLILGMLEWEWLFRQSGLAWLPHRETFIDALYSLCVMGLVLGLPSINSMLSERLSGIGINSFGIYLTHSPILEYFSKAVYHAAPALLGQQLLLFPILVIVGLGAPLLLMATVRRSLLRRSWRILFG